MAREHFTRFRQKYDAIKSSKFCHPQIFLLFTQFLKQDTNKDIQYFLPQDILRQDQQWTALMSFLAKTPYILQGEDFELKNCAYLSRVAVASVWAISIFFSKVEFNFESSPLELGNIRFCDYNKNSDLLIWLQNLDKALLNFISIITLCSSPFYEVVFRYNTEILIKSVNFMI